MYRVFGFLFYVSLFIFGCFYLTCNKCSLAGFAEEENDEIDSYNKASPDHKSDSGDPELNEIAKKLKALAVPDSDDEMSSLVEGAACVYTVCLFVCCDHLACLHVLPVIHQLQAFLPLSHGFHDFLGLLLCL